MARRRTITNQEREDFLDQNPELIRFETRIEPVKNDPPDPFFFNAEISQNGGPAFDGSPFLPSANGPFGMSVGLLDGPDFFLFADDALPPVPTGGALVTTGPKGFGVATFPSPAAAGFGSIEGGEVLGLFVDPGNIFFPGSVPPATVVDHFGIESFGIDFTATGSGTVKMRFFDFLTNESIVSEMAFSPGRLRGFEGRFEAEATADGRFEIVEVTTTGSLEISVTGIDLNPNFESGFMPM